MLRLVAEAPKPLAELDRDAVESLVRDGLVTVADGSAALPH
jgi:carbamate kinase